MKIPVSSQSAYPWRATARTVFQVSIALAALIPIVVVTGGIPVEGYVVTVLTACALVTRLMANPTVNAAIGKFAPWLLAEPRQP